MARLRCLVLHFLTTGRMAGCCAGFTGPAGVQYVTVFTRLTGAGATSCPVNGFGRPGRVCLRISALVG